MMKSFKEGFWFVIGGAVAYWVIGRVRAITNESAEQE